MKLLKSNESFPAADDRPPNANENVFKELSPNTWGTSGDLYPLDEKDDG